MRFSQTLRHLTDLATRDAFPRIRRAVSHASEGAEEAWRALIGSAIEERLARISSHASSNGVDPFGLDMEWGKYVLSIAALLYQKYFRVSVSGIEHVPQGRVLLIANHSGQIPIDAAMIGTALFFEAEPPRIIRSMVEKWTQTLPFVAQIFPRVGQVVGVPENALRLLKMEEAVLVFPEGVRGVSKPFRDRYKLADFGLGFMRLALETHAPIVPIAVVGAEEQYISFGNLDVLASLLHIPAIPILPQLLIPGLQLPLPTKYHLYFGEPLHFQGDPDDEDAAIEEKVWLVRTTIQSMLNRGLKERKGIFF